MVPKEFICFLCSLWLVNSSGEVLSWLFSTTLWCIETPLHSCAPNSTTEHRNSLRWKIKRSLSQLSPELAAFRTTKRITTVKITGFGLSVLHRGKHGWICSMARAPWMPTTLSTAASYQDFGVLTVSHWTTI